MTIEIQDTEVETVICRHMASGEFHDVDDLLSKALAAFHAPAEPPSLSEGESLLAVFDRIRGLLTDEEVDTLFARDRSPDRTIDLS